MPTLETIQGRSLVPNLAAALEKTVTGFREQEARQKQAVIAGDIATETELLVDPETSRARKDEALLRLTQLDPVVGQALGNVLKTQDEQAIKLAEQTAEQGLRDATLVQRQKTPEAKREAWRNIVQNRIGQNKDVTRDMEILELEDDEFNLAMQKMVIAGTDIKTLTAEQFVPVPGRPDLLQSTRSGEFKQIPARQVEKGEAGDVFIDPNTGETVAEIPLGPGGGLEFAKPAVKDFTPESVAAANAPGGSVSDLIIRPEVLASINEQGRFATGTSVLFKGKDGNLFIGTPVTKKDPAGNITTTTNVVPLRTPTGEEGQVVSREFGETPEQKTARLIREAGLKTRAERLALIETQAGLTGVKKRTERDFVNMDAALGAAENIPQLQQNLKLLNRIETGGIDAIVLATARKLGVESADQAELTFNLRTNVLKQLKPTFGAQFTEREGNLLAEIQASETKSTAGNIRLMKRAIEIYNRAIDRGLRAARRQGDDALIQDIEEARAELAPLTEAIEGAGAVVPAPQTGTAPPPPGQVGRFKVRVK